jgi:hypothetical protein
MGTRDPATDLAAGRRELCNVVDIEMVQARMDAFGEPVR